MGKPTKGGYRLGADPDQGFKNKHGAAIEAKKAAKYKNQLVKLTDEERELIRHLAGIGITQHQIARCVRAHDGGLDIETLRKHAMDDLNLGVAEANAKVANALFQKAIGGDTAAMIYWTKARLGWRENTRLELTGADGAPLQTSGVMVVPAALDPALWESQVASMQRALMQRRHDQQEARDGME